MPEPTQLSPSPPPAAWGWRRAVSFPVLLGVLLAVGAYWGTGTLDGFPGSKFLVEGDTWWHLKVGEAILATHAWPTRDTYSFTVSGQPWMAYEWLGEVVMALACRAGGIRGVLGLGILLAILLVLLLYAYATLRSGNSKASAVACALLLPEVAIIFTARPQVLGYILLVACFIILELFRRGNRRILWLLPALFLVWVNTHGSFILGAFVLAAYGLSAYFPLTGRWLEKSPWTDRQRRQLALVALLSAVCVWITPYGARLAAYPFQVVLLQSGLLQSLSEWVPLSLTSGNFTVLFPALLILFLIAQIVTGPLRYRMEDLILLAFAFYETLVHVRFMVFFAIIFAPLLAELVARWVEDYQPAKDKYALNAALIPLLAASMVLAFPSSTRVEGAIAKRFPRDAVAFLNRQAGLGRVFNSDFWGGYLIYSGRKVFIDGRADVYWYAGVYSDYAHIVTVAPDALFLLRKYSIGACLVSPHDSLATLLTASPEWRRTYEDGVSAIYVRAGSPAPAETHGAGSSK